MLIYMDLNPAVVFQPFFEGYSYALFMFHARCLIIIFTPDYVLLYYCSMNDMTILSDLLDTSPRSRTRVRCPITVSFSRSRILLARLLLVFFRPSHYFPSMVLFVHVLCLWGCTGILPISLYFGFCPR